MKYGTIVVVRDTYTHEHPPPSSQVQQALPLLLTVDEPRIIGAALVIWSYAAVHAVSIVEGQGDLDARNLS